MPSLGASWCIGFFERHCCFSSRKDWFASLVVNLEEKGEGTHFNLFVDVVFPVFISLKVVFKNV